MLPRILFVGLFFASACGGMENESQDKLDQSQDEIIGGTTDTSDSSVVAIFAHPPGSSYGSLCTGTIISPRAVLTAAHCLDPRVVGSGNVFDVLLGTTLSSSSTRLAVSATTFDPKFNPDVVTSGHDVGIATLANPTTLASVPYNRNSLSPSAVGASVRLIGYGSNTHRNTGAGTRRTVTTTIDDFNSLVIHIGTSSQETCHGDSGGPALMTLNGVPTIIGVTSYGQDRSTANVCINGGYDTRVDEYLSFIDAHL